MPYLTYKCAFDTPLHMGTDHPGNALGDAAMCVRSDTLFSALCHEAFKADCLDALYNGVASGRVALSDMLPYRGEEVYLPKPILRVRREDAGEGNSSVKKQMKRLTHIPLSRFADFVRGMTPEALLEPVFNPDFGAMSVTQCVGLREGEAPRPYQIGKFTFAPGCGLYLIARAASPDEAALLNRLLGNLGASGVGGRRSTGMGKFGVAEIETPATLQSALLDDSAPLQMLLSTALSADSELEQVLVGATYSLARRGGFVSSDHYAPMQVKKQTLYFFQSGSCFARRFAGDVFDVAMGGAHPVWRSGKGLWMGVSA